jgi:hypothetical protein
MPLPYKLQSFEMGIQFLVVKIFVFNKNYICMSQFNFLKQIAVYP